MRYRHKKRGTVYEVKGVAIFMPRLVANDMDTLYLYRSPTGVYFAYTDMKSNENFVGVITLQTANPIDGPTNVVTQLVIYEATDTTLWGRPAAEFLDGRFEEVIEWTEI